MLIHHVFPPFIAANEQALNPVQQVLQFYLWQPAVMNLCLRQVLLILLKQQIAQITQLLPVKVLVSCSNLSVNGSELLQAKDAGFI